MMSCRCVMNETVSRTEMPGYCLSIIATHRWEQEKKLTRSSSSIFIFRFSGDESEGSGGHNLTTAASPRLRLDIP